MCLLSGVVKGGEEREMMETTKDKGWLCFIFAFLVWSLYAWTPFVGGGLLAAPVYVKLKEEKVPSRLHHRNV